ncbi:hypothetical protein [Spongiibacter sp. UBA1325]|uniref:hypothetical protein n=1 Tax=Spongiibacter sp. UBA1325 TaxID=1947543 RepID=UPI00257B1CCE|nr:hypothetical protein [Spongiibacter sp. UBA1325]|tara:strand:- start:279 stop:464 length:186 start_codon:yes stop_codon:yes gene_type:complete
MSREQDIADIENLYPADADGSTRRIGADMLNQARNEVSDWREESDAVLARYAQLCRAEAGV